MHVSAVFCLMNTAETADDLRKQERKLNELVADQAIP
jgi:hypothetical protein